MGYGMGDGMAWFAGWHFLALPIMLVIAFAPTFIALARQHHNSLAIFALNLFFGWTVIGWIVALIWSLTATPGGSNEKG